MNHDWDISNNYQRLLDGLTTLEHDPGELGIRLRGLDGLKDS
jgi:hypothetical protein